jgi:Kae1-associated kinase Bud32
MFLASGAEASIELKGGVIIKTRAPKRYRIKELDEGIRRERTKMEARLISEARRWGVPTPILYDVTDYVITMEYIEGEPLKKVLNPELSERVGELVGRLHSSGIVHGDLTTSNLLLREDKIYLIDFGLAYSDKSIEAQGVDVHVLFQTYESTHEDHEKLIEAFIIGYRRVFSKADQVLSRVKEIEARGRYAQ